MNATHDELAGVVDLFGALTREELTTALTELAFKRGEQPDDDAVAAAVQSAVDAYALVVVEASQVDSANAEVDGDDTEADSDDATGSDEFLVPGPTAFPSLPPAAEDLPHIMDVSRRTIDREAVGEAVQTHLQEESTAAVAADDRDRAEQLLEVSYDLEAWAPVTATEIRATLEEQLEG